MRWLLEKSGISSYYSIYYRFGFEENYRKSRGRDKTCYDTFDPLSICSLNIVLSRDPDHHALLTRGTDNSSSSNVTFSRQFDASLNNWTRRSA